MDEDEVVEFRKELIRMMAIIFAIFFLVTVLLQFFPMSGNSRTFYRGQQFQLDGTGEFSLEGEGCVAILQSSDGDEVNTLVTKKDQFGTFRATVGINGQMYGKLVDAPTKGCIILVHDLNVEFRPSLLASEIPNIIATGITKTCTWVGIYVLCLYLVDKFS